VEDTFTDPRSGKSGTIRAIRHKYIARYQFVLSKHEVRFPSTGAIRSVSVDVSTPDGLAPLIEELKARHDWIEQEQEIYRNAPVPLAILAHKVGSDIIDAAEGLAAQELTLKVAHGAQDERRAAVRSIASNRGSGCVLDILALWTCWRLGSLDALRETCGEIYVARRTMDQLQARRERINLSSTSGVRSAQYNGGKIAVTE
ncbi:hypothetical protein HCO48_10215, partial [Lactobacillus delbrueckii subsp. bulgaricus]